LIIVSIPSDLGVGVAAPDREEVVGRDAPIQKAAILLGLGEGRDAPKLKKALDDSTFSLGQDFVALEIITGSNLNS
jgi:hypothetical protein